MGELLICTGPIAAMPYYIEGISWNVYSLEELCYYIETNTYLLEKDFMNEELCTWIGKEANNLKLAEKLRDIMHMNGPLSEFVLTLLVECGYSSKDTIKEINRLLQEMEEKSDFECNKIRADRLMEKEKYLGSIYEYKCLLESNEAGEQSKELIGNIWHNLGTAYGRLFLFKEAASCYEKAYKYNGNQESLKEGLMALACMKDRLIFADFVEKYQMSDTMVQSVVNEIELVRSCEEKNWFESRIDNLAELSLTGSRQKYHKEISDIIFNWKEEYRRICRI